MIGTRALSGLFGISLSLCLACGGNDDGGIAGPKGGDYGEPIEPEPPGEGSPGGSSGGDGEAGTSSGGGDVACGDLNLDCCEGGTCAEGFTCASDDTCQPAGEPAPAPEPAPAECGLAGQACCTTGDACPGALGKAQCCIECAGAPDFTCQCGESLQTGGTCKLCCVVCKDGHVKSGPLEVGAGQTCQAAAGDWCQQNRSVGADEGSGWRNDCG